MQHEISQRYSAGLETLTDGSYRSKSFKPAREGGHLQEMVGLLTCCHRTSPCPQAHAVYVQNYLQRHVLANPERQGQRVLGEDNQLQVFRSKFELSWSAEQTFP